MLTRFGEVCKYILCNLLGEFTVSPFSNDSFYCYYPKMSFLRRRRPPALLVFPPPPRAGRDVLL